mgnify:CR=1 FL=1
MFGNSYGNPFLMLLSACSGIEAVVLLSYRLNVRWIAYVGKNSMTQAGADQKQGINDSNPMSDVKQFLVNVGNRKGLVCRDASKIADSLML